MADTRELILLRLQTLLGQIEEAPVAQVFRNRGVLPNDKRPAAVLLDGAEQTRISTEGKKGRVVSGLMPMIMVMEPQIFVELELRPLPRTSEIGPLLSSYRNALLRAILHDDQLVSLVSDNGDIAYRGFATDMQTGNAMAGELQMFFAFHYPLDVASL